MNARLNNAFPHLRVRSFIGLVLGLLLLITCHPTTGLAHVGNQNVIFETQAGPYPIRVTIKPPGVVPGLAEIFIRVHTGQVDRVEALPVRYDTGKQGAPPPDQAQAIADSPGLYRAELWFMKSGAHSVIIQLSGPSGSGEVMVPFDALATRTLPLPPFLNYLLLALMALLVALAVSIVGAAVKHAVIPPGTAPSTRRIWSARLAMLGMFLFVCSLITVGKRWWDQEEQAYQNNQLYRPMNMTADLSPAPQNELQLTITDERFRVGSPLLPDHGKLMHLFLIKTDAQAIAHLHPQRTAWDVFKTTLPPLPAGSYYLFADITHETGFSHTLTNHITLSTPLSQSPPSTTFTDSADSFLVADSDEIRNDVVIRYTGENNVPVGEEIELGFTIRTANDEVVPLEPYLGMKSHLVVFERNARVYSHLHPSGSVSMASLQAFESRLSGETPQEIVSAKPSSGLSLPGKDEAGMVTAVIGIPAAIAFSTCGWPQDRK